MDRKKRREELQEQYQKALQLRNDAQLTINRIEGAIAQMDWEDEQEKNLTKEKKEDKK